jgi:hypothetical protein
VSNGIPETFNPFNGLTQAQIGERIGWSESKVKQYSALLSTVVTQVLNLARQYQIGRVTPEVTFATFNLFGGHFCSFHRLKYS